MKHKTTATKRPGYFHSETQTEDVCPWCHGSKRCAFCHGAPNGCENCGRNGECSWCWEPKKRER